MATITKKKKKKKQSSNLLEVQNAAKTMLANIRFQSVDKPIKTLAITSSVPNEGKTTTLIFLAQAIATSGKKVIIVDCDMRRRSLGRELKMHAQNGIYSVMSGEVNLQDAIIPTKIPNMDFLDVEPSIPNPSDILASKRMGSLISILSRAYDYVLFDAPPVGTFVDAAVLGARVDATILVVRPDLPKRDQLKMAYNQLVTAGANVIGICSTFEEDTGNEYYYAYYNEKGERVEGHHHHSEMNPSDAFDPLSNS
ncbi:MAG: CpsD/CapB family tyrosine-protein kinase [Coriobacteriales bacterium]|jgi:capsular exopolysaccharide synthesis family protein